MNTPMRVEEMPVEVTISISQVKRTFVRLVVDEWAVPKAERSLRW